MKQEIGKLIQEKEQELSNLKGKYNDQIEGERKKVLSSKSKGIHKSLYLLGFDFISSSMHTFQYLEFHRIFKRELKAILKPYCKEIKISKPNHFDITGFFKLNDDRIYYFSVGDLRWDKDSMLIRTAKEFDDYTGGSNDFINLNGDFMENLIKYLK